MQIRLMILLLGFVFATGAFAQSTGSWGAVQRMDSCKVNVERFDGKRVRGKFVRAGEDSIVVATKDAEVVVPRAEVRKVSCGGHKGLFIGLVSGLAVSSVVGIAEAVRHRDDPIFGEHIEFKHAALTLLTPVAGGTAIGIAADAARKPVYVAPARAALSRLP